MSDSHRSPSGASTATTTPRARALNRPQGLMLPTRTNPITTEADHAGQEALGRLVGRDRRGDVAPAEALPGQVAADVVAHAAQHDAEQQPDAVGLGQDQPGEAAHDPDVAEDQERRGHAGSGAGPLTPARYHSSVTGTTRAATAAKADSPPW